MARKMYEILGKNPEEGTFGVEIECEGENLFPIDNVYWKTEDDGSLRGVFPHSRCEWVFKKPLSLKKTLLAIKHLANKQEEEKAIPKFSFRTSVHVHVNVLDLTWDEYCSFIYLYLLLEEPLMNFCGQERIGNRFCLRLQDAEGLLDSVNYLFQTGPQGFRMLNEENIRYSAINIYATRKYGSLEFRGMRGTLDEGVLRKWINALNSLKESAKSFGGIRDIHEFFKNNRNSHVVEQILGEDFLYEGLDFGMNTSFSLCYELPFLYKEVEKRDEKAQQNPPEIVEWVGAAIAHNPIIPFNNIIPRNINRRIDDLFIADEGAE